MSDPESRRDERRLTRPRVWTSLAVAALLLAIGRFASGQQPGGAIAGKLTDLHSKPLDGVTITLRNASSGTEIRTVSGKGGAYRFRDLAPGEYELVAASPQLGTGSVAGLQVLPGHESHVQTAIALMPDLPRAASAEWPSAIPPIVAPRARVDDTLIGVCPHFLPHWQSSSLRSL